MIQFSARFAGVSREISIPMTTVQGIFARETARGMVFPPEVESDAQDEASRKEPDESQPSSRRPPAAATKNRRLQVVK